MDQGEFMKGVMTDPGYHAQWICDNVGICGNRAQV